MAYLPYTWKRRGIDAVHTTIRRSSAILRWFLPLGLRKALVVRLGRRRFRWSTDFTMGALSDLRRRNPETLHRFLWSNHLAYASRYEVERKFEPHNINPTRHILFRQIVDYHKARGLDPQEQVRSAFDVGCSLGYLLRHIESNLFPSAAPLKGIDIDRYAVQTGMAYLQSVRSKVELFEADLSRADEFMHGNQYDLVLCCGVLMYANEETAQGALRAMFAHCRRLVGIICLAHTTRKRANRSSTIRTSDGAYVHDMPGMIREAGGTPVSSTWIGTDTSGSSPSYVILAEPQARARPVPGSS